MGCISFAHRYPFNLLRTVGNCCAQARNLYRRSNALMAVRSPGGFDSLPPPPS